MRLLCDENIRGVILDALRAHGHDVTAIVESHETRGLTNGAVMDYARMLDAILMTADKSDFARALTEGHSCPGIILLRFPHSLPQALRAEIVAREIATHADTFRDHFTVIEAQGITSQQTLVNLLARQQEPPSSTGA